MRRPPAVCAVLAVAALARVGLAAAVTGIVIDTDRSVNCATYQSIVTDVTAGCRTDRDKAIAVFNFVVRNVWIPYIYDQPQEPAGGRVQTVYDPLKIINVYGAGGCGIQQGVFASLLKAAALEERGLSPGFAHVSNEVKWDGKWHWLDTWLPLYLTDETGEIYSYDALMADRTLITQAVQAGRTSANFLFNPQPDTNALLKASGHRPGSSAARPQRYVENLCLRPGESCTWLWDNVGKWYWPGEKFSCPAFKFNAEPNCRQAFPFWEPYRKEIKDGPHPWSGVYYRYYGNAVFASAPPLTARGLGGFGAKLTGLAFVEGAGVRPEKPAGEGTLEMSFTLPYVIADTEVEGAADVPEGARIEMAFSLDGGKTWQQGPAVTAGGAFGPVSLGKPNAREHPEGTTSGQYGFLLRLTLRGGSGGAPTLASLKVANTTMLNFQSRPWLEVGRNAVTVTTGGGTALSQTPLEVTWRWLEDFKDAKTFTHKADKSGAQCVIEVGGTKRPKMQSVTIACPAAGRAGRNTTERSH